MKTMKRMLAMLLVLAITVAFAPVTSAEGRAEIVMDFSNTTISGTATANVWNAAKDDISLITTPGYTVNKDKTYPSDWKIQSITHLDAIRNPGTFLQVLTGSSSRVWPMAYMAGSGKNQVAISFTVEAGSAGYYVPNLSGLTINTGADYAVYVDDTFVGNYSFYNANSPDGLIYKSGDEKPLNAVYLSEGAHNVFMRHTVVYTQNGQAYAYLGKMKFVPISAAPQFSKISTNLPDTIKVGETVDFTIGVDMTDGTKKLFGFAGNAGADTKNNISYQITEGADVINITGGELVAAYDEGLKGSITALKSGTAKIEISSTIDGEVQPVITRTITVEENNPNDVTTNPNVSVYIVAENAESSLISVTEGGVTAGNVGGEVARGTTITATANSNESYEFLYWMDNAKRYIQDDATYTFTAGTNTAVWAVYADKTDNLKLVDYFTDYGTRVYSTEAEDEASVTAPTLEMTGYTGAVWKKSIDNDEYVTFTPDSENATKAAVSVTLDGDPYKTGSYGDPVTVEKTLSGFVSWLKNGKLVSYNDNYTFFAWNSTEALVQSVEGEKSSFPGVVLFNEGSKYMLELVNCEGVEIIEKGILFDGTIDSCLKKFVSRTELSQFTIVEDSLTDAKAYVIYRDGADLRVAYSN